MFFRYPIAIATGLLVTLGLFWVMHALIPPADIDPPPLPGPLTLGSVRIERDPLTMDWSPPKPDAPRPPDTRHLTDDRDLRLDAISVPRVVDGVALPTRGVRNLFRYEMDRT